MSRAAAAAVLRNTPVGTYLCRFKSNENAYALSLKYVPQFLFTYYWVVI